jgi:hypothetical protein
MVKLVFQLTFIKIVNRMQVGVHELGLYWIYIKRIKLVLPPREEGAEHLTEEGLVKL